MVPVITMRALFLVHNLPERGSYFRAREIARRLAARGHDVTFVCTSEHKMYRPETRTADGLTLIESPNKTLFNDKQEGWGLFDNVTRLKLAKQQPWDLVFGFSHKPDCLFPGLEARRRGAKLVLDWSDWWGGPEGLYESCVIPSAPFQSLPRPIRWARRLVFRADARLESWAYEKADAAVLISEEFLGHPGAPEELELKSFVMHSGAPLDTIVPMAKPDARAAMKLNIPTNAAVVGYIANFHTDERLLLEAFARTRAQCPEAVLLVAGGDFDRSDPALHASIRDAVIHCGRIPFDKVGVFLGCADILALPLTDVALNRARYPHKLSDYVAAGRPIVASDVGETGRLLRRFQIGDLAPATPVGMGDALASLLRRQAEWDTLGQAVRQCAETQFNWDEMCGKLFEFLGARLKLKF
ncbi:MAG: glycosyltransferase [Candidatus Sumerlaeaceae bacterium]|nr:glycosyltransferase [Candidatus Sumerlaeaceae bacterium]